jgi:P27 family predicted phage terminase small subunit
MTKKYKDLKIDIINLLTKKNNYELTDDNLIDELIFNLYLCDKSKKDIEKNGIKINVRSEGKEPYYQLNLSTALYNQSYKNVSSGFTKLGISPSERMKLKISETKEKDVYDDIDEDDE